MCAKRSTILYEKKCFIPLLHSGGSTGNGVLGARHYVVKDDHCLISELKPVS